MSAELTLFDDQITTSDRPGWWQQLETDVQTEGHIRHSLPWYEAMLALYLTRFPDADERSKFNMREAVEHARERAVAAAETSPHREWCVGHGHPGHTFQPFLDRTWCACGERITVGNSVTFATKDALRGATR